MALGYLFAVVATVASGSGSILEFIGIRHAGAYGGTSLDLVALPRQWVYLLGLGVDLLGFVFAAAALHRLPLFLVQSALAFMGTRLAAAGWVALGLGAAGLILLGEHWAPRTRYGGSSWSRLVWAIVLNGLTAAVAFAMALQKGGATAVTAIMFTTNTALSSLIGLTYRGCS